MTAPHSYSRRAVVPASLISAIADFRTPALPALLVSALALSACATNKPPQISYDDPPSQPAVLETNCAVT